METKELKAYVIEKMGKILTETEMDNFKKEIKSLKRKDLFKKYKFSAKFIRDNIKDFIKSGDIHTIIEYQSSIYCGTNIMINEIHKNFEYYAPAISNSKYLNKIFVRYYNDILPNVYIKREDAEDLFNKLNIEEKYILLNKLYKECYKGKNKEKISKLFTNYNLELVNTTANYEVKVVRSGNVYYIDRVSK